ncbi:hypothetical protein TEQG_02797 [Trichophyton equinum CBS 127.97]|uniref:Uncharacterized protein n=1 Tax=Trichophyton equinum (strain ATCC MYA-4606 / CBS 127.97) TaxID=559882 RepID=F2PPE7_TRIEC|nr:hypothetical protein TEQG_02797 [Trichophyton equinum CBS 127.97]
MAFPTDFKIDEIVAFACGRIAQTLEDRLSPWTDIVERRVSDPAYTTIDYELLKMHAITTIDDPEGFLMIDDTTLVISMAPNIPVKGIIANTAQPAMIYRSNILATQFLDSSYSRTEFPHDPDNFKDVAMHAFSQNIYGTRRCSRSTCPHPQQTYATPELITAVTNCLLAVNCYHFANTYTSLRLDNA